MFTTALSTATTYATDVDVPNLSALATFTNTSHPALLDADGTTLLNNPDVLTAANNAQRLAVEKAELAAQLTAKQREYQSLDDDYNALNIVKDELNDQISSLEEQLRLATAADTSAVQTLLDAAIAEKSALERRIETLTVEKESLATSLSTANDDFIAAQKTTGMELVKISDYVTKIKLEEVVTEWQTKYDTATAALTPGSDIAKLVDLLSTIQSNSKYSSLQTAAIDGVKQALTALAEGISAIDTATVTGTPSTLTSTELSVDEARALIKSTGRSHVNATARMRTAEELNAYIKANSLI